MQPEILGILLIVAILLTLKLSKWRDAVRDRIFQQAEVVSVILHGISDNLSDCEQEILLIGSVERADSFIDVLSLIPLNSGTIVRIVINLHKAEKPIVVKYKDPHRPDSWSMEADEISAKRTIEEVVTYTKVWLSHLPNPTPVSG